MKTKSYIKIIQLYNTALHQSSNKVKQLDNYFFCAAIASKSQKIVYFLFHIYLPTYETVLTVVIVVTVVTEVRSKKDQTMFPQKNNATSQKT